MKFSTWKEFTRGLDDFERSVYNEKKKATQKIQQLKDNHPFFDEIVNRSIPFLPTPFNGIAQAIYNSLGSSKEDKVNEVIKFLEKIRSQTEKGYIQITSQLVNILGDISDIKAIVAKEDTLQLIKDVLTGKDNALDRLKKKIDEMIQLQKELEIELYQSYGLFWLPHDYFEIYKSSQKDFEYWMKGFSFKLESIKANMEFRRADLVNQIKNILEEEHLAFLVGGRGTSKTTIFYEIICDYYDKKDLEILYNKDNEIKNAIGLSNFIVKLLESGKKILVAVDNVHKLSNSRIFFVRDNILNHRLSKNALFLLTATTPDFDELLSSERLHFLHEDYKESIRKFLSDSKHRYDLPFFKEEEVKEFYKKYSKSSYNMSQNDIEIKSTQIYNETQGYAILVKFLVLGQGISNHVADTYFEYLKQDAKRLRVMLVCALLDIANVTITSDLLTNINLLDYAENLKGVTLRQESRGYWRTLHPAWDIELLSFLYNKKKDKEFDGRKKHLKKAIELIFNTKKEQITFAVISYLYDLALDKRIPVDIFDSTIQLPDDLSKESKASIYGLVIPHAYDNLGRYSDSLNSCIEALKIIPNFAEVWYNKGTALSRLSRYDEAIKCYDKAIEFKPNYAIAWYNKARTLCDMKKYTEAIECYTKAIEIKPDFAKAKYNKACSMTKKGESINEILKFLKEAIEIDKGYAEKAKEDADFETIKNNKLFKDLINQLQSPQEAPNLSK